MARWLPDSESDAAAERRQTNKSNGNAAARGRARGEAAELDERGRGAKWPGIGCVGGLGRMGWTVSC